MASTYNASTNSTGIAGIVAFMGNTTLNSSTPRYGFNATQFNVSGNGAAFYETPTAGNVRFYNVSASPRETDSSFTVTVSSYDVFSNINGTSAWNGTLYLNRTGAASLTYSVDGGAYSTWGGSVGRTLSSGNTTISFTDAGNDYLYLTFNDTGAVTATGTSSQVQVTAQGIPPTGGGPPSYSNPTPTPRPSITPTPTSTPRPTVAPTPDAGTPTPTRRPTATPYRAPTVVPTEQAGINAGEGEGAGGSTASGRNALSDNILLFGGLLIILVALYYWFAMRKPKKGL